MAKNHIILILLVAMTFGISVQAATVANLGSAPTVNGEDIAHFSGTSGGTFDVGKWWTDTNDPGQTFTTGMVNAYFNSFSLRVNGALASGTHSVTVRLSTISGSTLTPLYTETGTWNKTGAVGGGYVQFALDTPYLLNANTLYAVDVTATGANGTIPYLGWRASGTYSGGNRYYVNNGATSVTHRSTEDYNFHIDMTAVPEPSIALLSGLGVMLLLRRNKD